MVRRIAWSIPSLLALAGPASIAAAQGATERLSVATAGGQGAGTSDSPAISGSGRFVAFRSTASNLVPGDTNGVADIFVRDRYTGVVERVSVSSAGAQAAAASADPSISFDGRYVAFSSDANNLATDVPVSGMTDVFLRDRLTRTTRTVNRSSTGGMPNGGAVRPKVSADGRYVSFDSGATNMVPGTTTSGYHVFRRDMQGSTDLASVTIGPAPSGFTWNGGISAGGRYVAFVSQFNNLVPGDTNDRADCFVRDFVQGTTRRVSVSSLGEQGTGSVWNPCSMSNDGRWVTYSSDSPNLAPGEFTVGYDVFLHDTLLSQTFRISVNSVNWPADGYSLYPVVSDDGRFVAFQSVSTNLDPLDTDWEDDVFVRDRVTGVTRLVSRGAVAGGNLDSYLPAISADGSIVAFYSEASDLVPHDTNLVVDVFARDTGDGNHGGFCAGTTSACPCGNASQGGAGCENSSAAGGALLRGTGRASVGNDEVVLLATGLPPATSAVFFQGTSRENGGQGMPFGDGLRCVGGVLTRLSQYPVISGTAATGNGDGGGGLNGGSSTPVHTQGGVPAAGGLRTYQVWYRNSASYCTSAAFNLTNGVEILWTP